MDLCRENLAGMRDLLKDGEVSAVDLCRAHLNRIAERKSLNAFITIDGERAIDAARTADKRKQAGEETGLLAGLPLAVKDNICIDGQPTTCASKILDKFIPPYTATAVFNLLNAGAVIVGKTNLDEFGMGSSDEHSHFGPVKNPHDLSRTPGGSSGGSAAAVADFQVTAALGSDTGGSVRQPASFCGIVGLKPTYGAVSRYGLTAFASSFDQIGVLTRSVTDCEMVFRVICGRDEHDATSVRSIYPDDYSGDLKSAGRMRIGIPTEYFGEGLAPEVGAIVEKTIEELARDGRAIRKISLPHTKYAVAAYYIIANAEASANLARFDGVRYGTRVDSGQLSALYRESRSQGFGVEVKRRILLGTYVLSAGYRDEYYDRAQRVRTKIIGDFEDVFSSVDLLVCPTTPTTAFKLGEKLDDPLAMYLSDIYTVPASLAGLPALSVPCGTANGLPVGLQIIGPRFAESRLFSLATEIERLAGHRRTGV